MNATTPQAAGKTQSQKRWRESNRAHTNAKRKEWRNNIAAKECDCGAPAAHCQGSEFICERCFQMQKRYESSLARRIACGIGSTMTVHRLVL